MRVLVDGERCTGHGRCYGLAPTVYEADDVGYSVAGSRPVPPGDEDRARLGALNCPEDAIQVTEDDAS